MRVMLILFHPVLGKLWSINLSQCFEFAELLITTYMRNFRKLPFHLRYHEAVTGIGCFLFKQLANTKNFETVNQQGNLTDL